MEWTLGRTIDDTEMTTRRKFDKGIAMKNPQRTNSEQETATEK